VRLAGNLKSTVTAASAAGTLTRTNLLTAGDGGVSAWRAVAPISPVSYGTIAGRADAVAVSADATTAVTVEGTTATIWDVSVLEPVAEATLPYDVPVTALAFSPGAGLVLAAGHADGGVTVQTINLSTSRTTKRTLAAGGGGPVDAVALSADATTVAAVHQDGALSVWDLRAQSPQPSGQAGAAAGPEAHRVWLSATGDYAFVADAAASPALWSLADRHAPARMLALPLGDDPAIPAMISADGQTVASIDRNETLTLWNIKPFVDALADPIGRACQMSDMTEQRWRQLVPDAAFANPCAPPAPPSLGVHGE
jgi:WD40 repeat protein